MDEYLWFNDVDEFGVEEVYSTPLSIRIIEHFLVVGFGCIFILLLVCLVVVGIKIVTR